MSEKSCYNLSEVWGKYSRDINVFIQDLFCPPFTSRASGMVWSLGDTKIDEIVFMVNNKCSLKISSINIYLLPN